MNSDWSNKFEAGISWYKHNVKEIEMNQHDKQHYQYYRTDPYKHGYWEEDNTNWTDVIINSVCLIVALGLIGLVLFLN